jgi:hypothetical protein
VVAKSDRPTVVIPVQIPQIKNRSLVNLDSFNLEATPVTTVTGATGTELGAQTQQTGNLDGNELHLAFLDDVTHQYPNGTNNLPLGSTLPIGSGLVCPFFAQHPR